MLPTGFGKSLCYGVLPFIFDELEKQEEGAIVIVVTPLTAIMKDQVFLIIIKLVDVLALANIPLRAGGFSAKGVKSAYVTGELGNERVKRAVYSGKLPASLHYSRAIDR